MADKNDRELFHRALADAKPLKGRARATPPPAAPKPAPAKAEPPRAKSLPTRVKSPDASLPELMEGDAPGLDRAASERLKRGQAQIEATLDLHGMILARAEPELAAFLERSQAMGRKLVLVVTGKGTRIDPDTGRAAQGAIRREFAHWLNLEKNRARIVGFRRAHAVHGGAGAFYVVLRKRR